VAPYSKPQSVRATSRVELPTEQAIVTQPLGHDAVVRRR
jgi:hypothetical protein